MKNRICKLLFAICLVPNLVVGQTPTNLDAEIKRVESGLIAPFTVKGEPGDPIEERMKFYKVPGLSVAVIKDFKIAWAKAYGVKDIQTKEGAGHCRLQESSRIESAKCQRAGEAEETWRAIALPQE